MAVSGAPTPEYRHCSQTPTTQPAHRNKTEWMSQEGRRNKGTNRPHLHLNPSFIFTAPDTPMPYLTLPPTLTPPHPTTPHPTPPNCEKLHIISHTCSSFHFLRTSSCCWRTCLSAEWRARISRVKRNRSSSRSSIASATERQHVAIKRGRQGWG